MNAFYLQKESEVNIPQGIVVGGTEFDSPCNLVLAAAQNASRQEARGSDSDDFEFKDFVQFHGAFRRLPAV